MSDAITDYIRLGLDLGRHVDGFVDAYYGPSEMSEQAAQGAPPPAAALVERARRLLGDLESDADLEARRRTWIRAQVEGLLMSARKLAGDPVGYLDEIEACYGVAPSWREEDEFAADHRRLAAVLPARADTVGLAERYGAWIESNGVPPDRLEEAVRSLAEDFRERTARQFGLPDGETVEFLFESDKPWAGFNYYMGDLRSRVAINVDLPVLSTSLGHLVAHEAYPGHHTEHSRKEVGLVRRRQHLEESIFLVGTPQCLVAEGLADLGLEVIAGEEREAVVASHLHPLGIHYDPEVAAEVRRSVESLGSVRGNAAIGIHERGWTLDEAVDYIERWSLLPRRRAEKAVQFLVDPTWRAYTFCYIEGVALCRRYVNGDPTRFERLITDQLVPSQLAA
jgi:hypothetical protein